MPTEYTVSDVVDMAIAGDMDKLPDAVSSVLQDKVKDVLLSRRESMKDEFFAGADADDAEASDEE